MRHAAGRLSVVAAALFLGGCTTVGPDFARPAVPWLSAWKGESVTRLAAGQAQRPPAVDAAIKKGERWSIDELVASSGELFGEKGSGLPPMAVPG